jgi:hypothetical protein
VARRSKSGSRVDVADRRQLFHADVVLITEQAERIEALEDQVVRLRPCWPGGRRHSHPPISASPRGPRDRAPMGDIPWPATWTAGLLPVTGGGGDHGVVLTDPRLTRLFVRFLIRGAEYPTEVAKLVGLEREGGHDLIGNVEECVSHAAKFFTTQRFFTARHTGYISEASSAWTRAVPAVAVALPGATTSYFSGPKPRCSGRVSCQRPA